MAARLDESMPVGNEGAGVVIQDRVVGRRESADGQDGRDDRRRDVCRNTAP